MNSKVEIIENGSRVEKEIELVGRKLHLLRGKVSAGLIALTDTAEDETGWYQILAVSHACEYFTPEMVGCWVYLPEISVGVSFKVGPGERIVEERWFGQPGGPPLAVFKEHT